MQDYMPIAERMDNRRIIKQNTMDNRPADLFVPVLVEYHGSKSSTNSPAQSTLKSVYHLSVKELDRNPPNSKRQNDDKQAVWIVDRDEDLLSRRFKFTA